MAIRVKHKQRVGDTRHTHLAIAGNQKTFFISSKRSTFAKYKTTE